jgi:hypothetical protein
MTYLQIEERFLESRHRAFEVGRIIESEDVWYLSGVLSIVK